MCGRGVSRLAQRQDDSCQARRQTDPEHRATPLLQASGADHPAQPEGDRFLHGFLPAIRGPGAPSRFRNFRCDGRHDRNPDVPVWADRRAAYASPGRADAGQPPHCASTREDRGHLPGRLRHQARVYQVTAAKIFCVANQKGGVGKTTTTVNLAAGLGKVGQRVLMVDLDPQGNATMGSGIDKRQLKLSVYDVLLESATIAQARVKSEKCGYDVVGSNRDLAGAEVELVDLDHRDQRLKRALVEVSGDYDFILIDCPPSLSMLTLNGLCAAHGVIVPMQCEYFALEGLTDLVNTIKQVHANLNKNLQIIGLLRVMFDPRITLQQQVSEQLKSHFGDKVFDTVIPRNVRLAEAPSYGLPGVVFDPAARGSQAFIAFAQELIEKMPPASAFASGAVAPPIAPVERTAPDLAIPADVLAPVASPS